MKENLAQFLWIASVSFQGLCLVMHTFQVEQEHLPKTGQRWEIPSLMSSKDGRQASARVAGLSVSARKGETPFASAAEMLNLVFRDDTLVAFTLMPEEARIQARDFVHTNLSLGQRSHVLQRLFGRPSDSARETLVLNVLVDPDPRALVDRAVNLRKMASGVPAQLSHRLQLPHLGSLGDNHWFHPDSSSLSFVRGHVGVDIDHARGGGGTDLLVAAAVGVLYRIHLNPRLAGKNYSTIVNVRGKVLKGTLVEGMTMVPLEELQKLGLNTRKEGIGVKVSNGKEWVRLVPFAWSMHSSAGERALRLPAINGNEGLVVPAADVLKALGYRL